MNRAPSRVRFAPSPTGHLHIGTARTALFNWLYARHYGGEFLLRIEDTDRARSTQEYEDSIIDSLNWLGFNWDEGPEIGGNFGPYRQSERRNIYQETASRLLEQGRVYYCYCTPEELEVERERALAGGRMPMYSGRCRKLTESERVSREARGLDRVSRFYVQPSGPYKIEFTDLIKGNISLTSEVIGDFIIMKADGMPTYNFAAAVDDLTMRITDVLRGEDHITNTARQIIILSALGETPPAYGHFSMILGPDKTKLSKRHGATSINEYRDRGYLPDAIVNYLALLSWSSDSGEEIFSLKELVNEFSVERVSKSPAIFDQPKLDWINGQWIRSLPLERLADLIDPVLKNAGMAAHAAEVRKVAEAVRSNLTTLAEAPKYARIFFSEPEFTPEIKGQLSGDSERQVLNTMLGEFNVVGEIDMESSKEIIKKTAENLKDKGIKGKAVYHPLRLALTGEDSGPELYLVLNALGKDKVVERLRKALELKTED